MARINNLEKYPISDNYDNNYFLGTDTTQSGSTVNYTFDGLVGHLNLEVRGDSAYQIAVKNGFVGTQVQWLASLKGAIGLQGLPPQHQWVGTSLRFQNPDGTFGTAVNLKGDTGFKTIDPIFLSPTDPAPTANGTYKPTVSSKDNINIDPVNYGTLYPNANNFRAKEGFDTLFNLVGGVWTKSETKIEVPIVSTVFDKTTSVQPQGGLQIDTYIKKLENLGATKFGSVLLPDVDVNPLTFPTDAYVDDMGNVIPFINGTGLTGLIPIPDGYLSVQVDESALFSVSLYTANGTWIQTLGTGNGPVVPNKVFPLPANAKQLRYARQKTGISGAYVRFLGTVASPIYYKFPTLFPNENKLNGKKVAWFGTSIPAGFPKQSDQNTWAYPNIIVNRNKGVIYNRCVPNGVMRKAKADGTSMGVRDTLSFTNLSSAINYQTSLLDKFGTVDEPDIIVFDYSVNDYDADPTDINTFATFDMTSENLNTFIGSFNFVIEKILTLKPNKKIYLLTHFSDDSAAGSPSYANVNRAIEKIGDYWGLPTLQLCYKTGWVKKNGIDIISTIMPDKIHPADSLTTDNVNKLADIIEGFLLTN